MFSPDSDVPHEQMLRAAAALGMEYFAVTEHVDFDYPPAPCEVVHDITPTDVAAYFEYVAPLKSRFAGRVHALFGCEFGFDLASDMTPFSEIEKKYPIDLIINSVHAAEGINLFHADNLVTFTKREAYGIYLRAVLDSLDAPYGYEVIGHLGYVSRNAPYDDRPLRFEDFPDELDAILRGIISRDKTLELNTSVRRAGSDFLPHPSIVRRYAELRGEHYSFGSDSHAPPVGKNYAAVRSALESLGVRYLDVFEERRRIKVKL